MKGNSVKQSGQAWRAVRVFMAPTPIDSDASKPEDGEVRRKAVGMIEGRLVVYAERGDQTRIISARRCNAAEARRYGPIHP